MYNNLKTFSRHSTYITYSCKNKKDLIALIHFVIIFNTEFAVSNYDMYNILTSLVG